MRGQEVEQRFLRSLKKGPAKSRNPKPQSDKGGRPRNEINVIEVEKLCALGCTQNEIANWLHVSESTIDKRIADTVTTYAIEDAKTRNVVHLTFRELMNRGYARVKISIRRQQLKLVEEGNPTMCIWMGKQLLGQKDKIVQEVATKKGGATLAELLEIYAQFDREGEDK